MVELKLRKENFLHKLVVCFFHAQHFGQPEGQNLFSSLNCHICLLHMSSFGIFFFVFGDFVAVIFNVIYTLTFRPVFQVNYWRVLFTRGNLLRVFIFTILKFSSTRICLSQRFFNGSLFKNSKPVSMVFLMNKSVFSKLEIRLLLKIQNG